MSAQLGHGRQIAQRTFSLRRAAALVAIVALTGACSTVPSTKRTVMRSDRTAPESTTAAGSSAPAPGSSAAAGASSPAITPGSGATVSFAQGAPVNTGRSTVGASDAARPASAGKPAIPTGGHPSNTRSRPMGLFGQMPNAPLERSSPLDSPDNLRRVTFANEGADFDPAVDPTGQWMVYASTQHRASSDLYIKRIEGTAVTQLTNDPGSDCMPTVSPDGKTIAFASDRSGNWDIYLVDVNGGQPVQLTNDPTQEISPSFSRDGKHLVYCSYGAQSGQWELVLVDVDRPATKRFIGYGLFPRYSPIEDKIVFQRSRERGTRWFSIWTVDIANGEAVRPTEIAASANAACITPNWSPDGKSVVFCTVIDPTADEQTKPSQADIWMVNSDGSGRVNLTHSQFANLQPVWAPGGAIYFVSNRSKDGTENVFAIRPDRSWPMARMNAGSDATAKATATPAAGVKVEPTARAATAAPAPTGATAQAKPEKTAFPVEAVPPATTDSSQESTATAETDGPHGVDH